MVQMVEHQEELEPQMLPFAAHKEVVDERMDMCNKCEDYTKLRLCSNCMCFMPYKTKLSFAKCPKGKW